MTYIADAMNVTRALFAPPKVKVVENKEVMFGGAVSYILLCLLYLVLLSMVLISH